jgi:hypothetical protein
MAAFNVERLELVAIARDQLAPFLIDANERPEAVIREIRDVRASSGDYFDNHARDNPFRN